jgi:hypothetical protein
MTTADICWLPRLRPYHLRAYWQTIRGDSRPNQTPPSLPDPGHCRSEADVADHPCSIKSPGAPSWNPRLSPPYLNLSIPLYPLNPATGPHRSSAGRRRW